MKCVIVYNRLLERYESFDKNGFWTYCSGGDTLSDLALVQNVMALRWYTEVPLNSKEGQRIVAKIGLTKDAT